MLLADCDLAGRFREGSFVGPTDGGRVYFQDADTLRDAIDLYSVVSELAASGSPNVENQQALSLVSTLQGGTGLATVTGGGVLSAVEVGQLLALMDKYSGEIAALRASPDRDGQDLLAVPDPETALLINEGM